MDLNQLICTMPVGGMGTPQLASLEQACAIGIGASLCVAEILQLPPATKAFPTPRKNLNHFSRIVA